MCRNCVCVIILVPESLSETHESHHAGESHLGESFVTVAKSHSAVGSVRTRRETLIVGDERWLVNECHELFAHFNHRCVESLLRATRVTLEMMRKRCFTRG